MLACEIAAEEGRIDSYMRQVGRLQRNLRDLTERPSPLKPWESAMLRDEQVQSIRSTIVKYENLIQEHASKLAELRRRNIFGTNPIIKRAERRNLVYLNVELPEMVWPDAEDLQIKLDSESLFNISATVGAGPQHYDLNLHLQHRVTLQEQK